MPAPSGAASVRFHTASDQRRNLVELPVQHDMHTRRTAEHWFDAALQESLKALRSAGLSDFDLVINKTAFVQSPVKKTKVLIPSDGRLVGANYIDRDTGYFIPLYALQEGAVTILVDDGRIRVEVMETTTAAGHPKYVLLSNFSIQAYSRRTALMAIDRFQPRRSGGTNPLSSRPVSTISGVQRRRAPSSCAP